MAWAKEERQEYDHHYYLAHREKRLIQNKAWRESNKEYLSEYSRKRYLMNKEKILAYQKEHRRKKKEEKKMKEHKIVTYGVTETIKLADGRKAQIVVNVRLIDPKTHEPISFRPVTEPGHAGWMEYELVKRSAKTTKYAMKNFLEETNS